MCHVKKNNEIIISKDKWVVLKMKVCPCCLNHELRTALGDLDVDVEIRKLKVNQKYNVEP